MMSLSSGMPFQADVRCTCRPVTSTSIPAPSWTWRVSSAVRTPIPGMVSGRESMSTSRPLTLSPEIRETSTPPETDVLVAAASATRSIESAVMRPSSRSMWVMETMAVENSA